MMIMTEKLNDFEKSLEQLAKKIYASDDNHDIYRIEKKEDYKIKAYKTQFNGFDVEIEAFSRIVSKNYKLSVKENNKPIAHVTIDEGNVDENLGLKAISYTLAEVNISNNEEVKADLISVYLQDIVNHVKEELNEKLKLMDSKTIQEMNYQSVVDRIKKLKQEKLEVKTGSANKPN